MSTENRSKRTEPVPLLPFLLRKHINCLINTPMISLMLFERLHALFTCLQATELRS